MFSPRTRKLTQAQRNITAEKVMEWGNFIFIGLVVTQIIPGPLLNPLLASVGVIVLLAAYWFAIHVIMKGGGL